MIETTDALVDRVARAIWDADMDASNLLGVLGDVSFARSLEIYRRRARAAIEALQVERLLAEIAQLRIDLDNAELAASGG